MAMSFVLKKSGPNAREPMHVLINPFSPKVRKLILLIEVLHGGHVACQEQYNIIPMEQNVHKFVMQNIFIVPGMQHGRHAKPLLRTIYFLVD